eukprot:2830585-Rhodomonas_salina.1
MLHALSEREQRESRGREGCTQLTAGQQADSALQELRCEQEAGVDYPGDAVRGDLKWEFNVPSADKSSALPPAPFCFLLPLPLPLRHFFAALTLTL